MPAVAVIVHPSDVWEGGKREVARRIFERSRETRGVYTDVRAITSSASAR